MAPLRDASAEAGAPSAPRTARARVRAQLTAEIVDVARRHLATSGAAGLSLRAVARELGMVSSAVYRYFPSRDDLLTTLIVEGYDALGEAVERAEAEVPREDLPGRWTAACLAARTWALAHPHEYALLYGSPVPGYAAPQDTIAPAGRVGMRLAGIVVDGLRSGAVRFDGSDNGGTGGTGGNEDDGGAKPGADGHATPTVAPGLLAELGLPPSSRLGSALVFVWSALFGAIGFELFGHTHNVVLDHEAHFHDVVAHLARTVGLPSER